MIWRATEARLRADLDRKPGDPRLKADLGLALLGQGRWADGFQLMEAWREDPELAADTDLPFPRWRGEPLEGRSFLILSEHGLGDQIMMARFARMLAERGAAVSWLCPRPLARLFSECLGIHAVPAEGAVDIRPFDFYSPSMALASLFMPPLQSPPGGAYLDAPPSRQIEGLRIGVAARGNPKHKHDAHRSLPEDQAARLLSLPGAVSILPEDTGARDFYETAQIVAGLDLVVTVDSAPAHLAGALGKPVWILLPSIGLDWRWLAAGETSPWYDSARLIRQSRDGDWSEVVDRVCADLT